MELIRLYTDGGLPQSMMCERRDSSSRPWARTSYYIRVLSFRYATVGDTPS